jgi:dienelactone hydrolase
MGEWANWLKKEGYVTLTVDSFSPRGSRNACQGERPRISEAAGDALAALRYIETLPFVDRNRVAVMGWSHGGGAALEATSPYFHRWSGFGDRSAFRAAVAFYPRCESLDQWTQTPTLMLLAGRDDWTPPDLCVAVAERVGPRRISWKVYPDAHHAFDQPGSMRTYLGHVMAYDGSATDASRNEVRTFLAEQLRGKQ